MQKAVEKKSTLQDEINAYSEEVIKRGADEVMLSRQNVLMMLNWDKLMESPMVKKSLGRNEISTDGTVEVNSS